MTETYYHSYDWSTEKFPVPPLTLDEWRELTKEMSKEELEKFVESKVWTIEK